MRYKVRSTETIEYVIEANNEQEVIDWMECNTIREVRSVCPNLKIEYNEEIVEKTVMPADVTVDTYIEDIIEM